MSLPANLPSAILETILTGLATFFLAAAGGDAVAAREAASHMLASYNPENVDEMRLAANIISFGLQAIGALAQATPPDTPVLHVLRLRSSAIGLNREAGKAERRLTQLQKARAKATSAETQPEAAQPEPAQPEPAQPEPAQPAAAQPESAQPEPKLQNTLASAAIPTTTETKGAAVARLNADRQAEAYIAASLQRAEARFGPMAIASLPAGSAHGGPAIGNLPR